MRGLAVVVVVVLAIPLALVGWQWRSDRSTERMLVPIASAVAGHHVRVECQSLWASLLDARSRHGEVRFDAAGVPERRIFLTHPTCDRLQGFAGGGHHEALDCLAPIDWRQRLPLAPRSDCFDRAGPTMIALMTLAHEAYHTTGVKNEATTNCYAIQAVAFVAVQLGAPTEEAGLVARAMAALAPLQGGGYGTDRCRAGTELDLHPETPAFPTEHPVLAPMGLRGSRAP